MRTITKTLYNFDELSESAKEKAISDFRYNDSYCHVDDNKAVLDEFCKVFPVKVKDYEYSSTRHSYISMYCTADSDIEELTGQRLATYIYNNYYKQIVKGKFYSTSGKYVNGKYSYKFRHSKVIMEIGGCPLTGYYMDYDILQPIFDFMKKPDSRNFTELLQDCLDNWVKACVNDCEACESDEYITETIQANEYEFYEDGELFFGSKSA